MSDIYQVQWVWTGFPGAPGYTNLFFTATAGGSGTEALAAVTKSKTLWSGLTGTLNSNCHIDVHTDVRVLDDVTGTLTNIFTVSGVTGVTGAGSNPYPGVAGYAIEWLTATVHGSRRMRGRTFCVPAARDVYDADGSLTSSSVLTIATAAEAMRTASGPALLVWGRPRAASAGPPPVTARAGLSGPAISSRVPDKVAVMRSRAA